jgi:plasmid replication initiation protein
MRKNEIVMSNNFIEACYRCTLNEKKIVNAGVYKLNELKLDIKNIDPDKSYDAIISNDELYELTGLDYRKDFNSICEALKLLNKKVIVMKDTVEKKQKTRSLITGTDIGNNQIILKFSGEFVPYANALGGGFTLTNALNNHTLHSVYSIRFYEFIKQYELIGARTLTLDFLREKFDLKDKYKKYNDFKKRVIIPAFEELKIKSEICFSYKENKPKRKVIGIILHIDLSKNAHAEADIDRKLNKYFSNNAIGQFYNELRTYSNDSNEKLSLENKKYITQVIYDKQPPSQLSKILLYRFFIWKARLKLKKNKF